MHGTVEAANMTSATASTLPSFGVREIYAGKKHGRVERAVIPLQGMASFEFFFVSRDINTFSVIIFSHYLDFSDPWS